MAKTLPQTAVAPGPTDPARSGMSGQFDLREVAPSWPPARGLIAAHLSQMHEQTPADSVHAIDVSALEAPGVTFFGLFDGGDLVAVGGFKALSETQAELKSMHVSRRLRGRGAGRALLSKMIQAARSSGLRRLYLETGATEAFLPARRMYLSAGFAECGPFADYQADPHSTFMTREI